MKYKLNRQNKVALLQILQTGEIDSDTLPDKLKGDDWSVEVNSNSSRGENMNREQIVAEIHRLVRNRMGGRLGEWIDYLDNCFGAVMNVGVDDEFYQQMIIARQKLDEFRDYINNRIEQYDMAR
jgi:hypothetical protein